MKSHRQHLIIDADDTLWENNIYFEQAFEQFCDILAHSHLSALEIRDILDEIDPEAGVRGLLKLRCQGSDIEAFEVVQCQTDVMCQRGLDDIAVGDERDGLIRMIPAQPLDCIDHALLHGNDRFAIGRLRVASPFHPGAPFGFAVQLHE